MVNISSSWEILDSATVLLTPQHLPAPTFICPPEMLQEGDQTYKVDVWSLFVQESFVRGPIGLRLLRRSSGQFCLQPPMWIRFQRFGKWQSSTRKNVLVLRRCRTQHSTESSPSSHHQSFSRNRRRQSSSPSSSRFHNSTYTNKTERFSNECEYIYSPSSVPC
jgi:hypothetical protein